MVAIAVSLVKPSHVSELSKRPSTENISPHYSLDKLYNRFFYDLKALAAESADPLWDHPC